jgi:hypothetical protein
MPKLQISNPLQLILVADGLAEFGGLLNQLSDLGTSIYRFLYNKHASERERKRQRESRLNAFSKRNASYWTVWVLSSVDLVADDLANFGG